MFDRYKFSQIFKDKSTIEDEIFDALTVIVPGDPVLFDTPELNLK